MAEARRPTRRAIALAVAALAAAPATAAAQTQPPPKRYRCIVCNHIYDPAEGDPATGVQPGTRFEDLPADWHCPECGATKADFEAME